MPLRLFAPIAVVFSILSLAHMAASEATCANGGTTCASGKHDNGIKGSVLIQTKSGLVMEQESLALAEPDENDEGEKKPLPHEDVEYELADPELPKNGDCSKYTITFESNSSDIDLHVPDACPDYDFDPDAQPDCDSHEYPMTCTFSLRLFKDPDVAAHVAAALEQEAGSDGSLDTDVPDDEDIESPGEDDSLVEADQMPDEGNISGGGSDESDGVISLPEIYAEAAASIRAMASSSKRKAEGDLAEKERVRDVRRRPQGRRRWINNYCTTRDDYRGKTRCTCIQKDKLCAQVKQYCNFSPMKGWFTYHCSQACGWCR